MARWLLTVLLVSPMSVCTAEPLPTGFQNKIFKNADGHDSPYVVFIPKGYDGTKPMPVILFLHGSGETKGGKKQPVEVGIGPAIQKREATFPFITVIPQSEKRTWKAESEDGQRALAILADVMKTYKTDPQRVYLTGLSMGGYGTWSLAAAHPEKWAAIVPVCGGGDPNSVSKFQNIPCWCFHGDADKGVPVTRSREMISALKTAGAKPRYTEYPGVPHKCWDKAYGTDELYTWLLAQKK